MNISKLKLPGKAKYKILTILVFVIVVILPLFLPYFWILPTQKNCDITIHITGNILHTDIFVPVQTSVFDWHQFMELSEIGKQTSGNYQYLALGWGDRQVYLESPTFADLQLPTALKALFIPTPSVLRVQVYQTLPVVQDLKPLNISENNYLKLVDFLQNSFRLDSAGKPIRIGYGYGIRDSFYEAKDVYSLLRHCNTWVAEALRAACVQTPRQPSLPLLILKKARSSC